MCQTFKIDVVKKVFPWSVLGKVRDNIIDMHLFLVMLLFSRHGKIFKTSAAPGFHILWLTSLPVIFSSERVYKCLLFCQRELGVAVV